MIQVENVEVVGWEAAIRGMRNPMNSWEKSDSGPGCNDAFCRDCGFNNARCGYTKRYRIGPNDHDLMIRLAKSGPVHAKYRRMITVYVDITAPLYWWKEHDQYKVGTTTNSCSTMHKIHAKEFALEDFSHEYLIGEGVTPDHWDENPYDMMVGVINCLNYMREYYLKTKNKKFWWQMIQLLPSSYNQKRTVMLNYEVLAGIYPMRKNHMLDEWVAFCKWIESLPYSEIITGKNAN